MHKSSLVNMKQFRDEFLSVGQRYTIVDIGSQNVDINNPHASYKSLFTNKNWDYIGCDVVSGNNVDIVFDNIYDWRKQLKSNSVDVVISGQAFEHIEFFWASMSEISRVLKEGGLCCLIVPSSGIRHRYPLDCWRFYEDGLTALAKYTRLDVLQVYTQRNRFDSPNFNEMWKDSVLICQKPHFSLKEKYKNWLCQSRNRKLVRDLPLVDREMPEVVLVQLFLDTGMGFNEKESIKYNIDLENGIINIYFDISSNLYKFNSNLIQKVRFDPADKVVTCKLLFGYIVKQDGTIEPLILENTNGEIDEKENIRFLHTDPNIYFRQLQKPIELNMVDYIHFELEYKIK